MSCRGIGSGSAGIGSFWRIVVGYCLGRCPAEYGNLLTKKMVRI